MLKAMKKTRFIGFLFILFGLCIGVASVHAAGNESTELPSPISFWCDTQLMKNAVQMDAIDFELSESNPAVAYKIAETDSNLIFKFDDVSTAVNMSLLVGDGSEYCVGFHKKSNEIYVQINPDLEYEFELSLGVVGSYDMKQAKIVDACSGRLEIYQVES